MAIDYDSVYLDAYIWATKQKFVYPDIAAFNAVFLDAERRGEPMSKAWAIAEGVHNTRFYGAEAVCGSPRRII